MAHGPVNKAWYVRLANGITFKINKGTYDKIRDEHPDAIISVRVGSRTDLYVKNDSKTDTIYLEE